MDERIDYSSEHPHPLPCTKCGAELFEYKKNGNLRPIRILLYQPLLPVLYALLNTEHFLDDMNQWKAREQGKQGLPKKLYSDVYDGELFQQLATEHYFDSETNLVSSFNVDWYNPFHKRQYSIGRALTTFKQLPPHLRNLVPNQVVNIVWSGPLERKNDMETSLMPFITELHHLSTPDHIYMRTYRSSKPVPVQLRILQYNYDLVALARVCRIGGTNAKHGCFMCEKDNTKLKRKSNNSSSSMLIEESKETKSGKKVDWSGIQGWPFPRRTNESIREAAAEWKDETDEEERKALFGQTGVAFTPFLLLKYFRPADEILVDPMHCLWLGVAKTLLDMFKVILSLIFRRCFDSYDYYYYYY